MYANKSIKDAANAKRRKTDFLSGTSYLTDAERLTATIQQTFWDAKAKKYRRAAPPEANGAPFDFMWANGIQFSALVGGLRYAPGRYAPLITAFFDGLNDYWDERAMIPGYDAYLSSPGNSDKYYDDNAWMVITLAEAYELTRERKYLDRAIATLRFVLSGWDGNTGGGIYWREDRQNKNTCSNGPAAVAALAVARYYNPNYYVGWARRIVAWTCKTLQAPDGAFYDNIAVAGKDAGKVERTQWTYNTALMLRANLDLWRFTKETAFLGEAKRLARASEKIFVNPHTGAFRDDANFSHLLVEAFLDLYRETKEPHFLDCARKNADFALKILRDPKDDLYWRQWDVVANRKEERKLLMANAPIARMFWLLANVATP